MTPLLTVENLHTYYGASHVLFGVSLEVNEGEVVVLLGRNGAGKTTTLKSIMGILECRSDAIRFRGDSIGGLSSDAVCRAGLGYVPEDCRIFRGLSVHENLEVARRAPRGKSKHTWTDERIFELVSRAEGRACAARGFAQWRTAADAGDRPNTPRQSGSGLAR